MKARPSPGSPSRALAHSCGSDAAVTRGMAALLSALLTSDYSATFEATRIARNAARAWPRRRSPFYSRPTQARWSRSRQQNYLILVFRQHRVEPVLAGDIQTSIALLERALRFVDNTSLQRCDRSSSARDFMR